MCVCVYIYIRAVKQLIASKIKVFVYIIYVCVLCIFIIYIKIQTHACIYLNMSCLYIKYIYNIILRM